MVDDDASNQHEAVLVAALTWLGESYGEQIFYVEHDVVYMLQQRLRGAVDELADGSRVYNDYPMLPGPEAEPVG